MTWGQQAANLPLISTKLMAAHMHQVHHHHFASCVPRALAKWDTNITSDTANSPQIRFQELSMIDQMPFDYFLIVALDLDLVCLQSAPARSWGNVRMRIIVRGPPVPVQSLPIVCIKI